MDIFNRVIVLVLTCMFLPLVARADFECLCNYNVEWKIYSTPATTSNSIGMLYEFDCKPTVPESEHDGFKKVQFEQQVGFVEMNNQIQIQTCSGDPSPLDIVTTVAATTATVTSPGTPVPSTAPSTVTTVTSTVTSTSTTIRTTTATTTTATPITTTSSTIPTSTATASTSTLPTTITTQQTNTGVTVSQGHIEACPGHVKDDITLKGGFLGQYGSFCYQLVDWTRVFKGAEDHCHSLSGNLVSIGTQGEQDYVQNWLSRNNFTRSAWIGLNDIQTEGQLTWTSGDAVSYTNFHGGYNQHSVDTHKNNDCFAIQPMGEWVDIPCGVGIFVLNFGEQHPFICQYNVTAKLHTLFEALPDLIVG